MHKLVLLAATCLLSTCARPDYADMGTDRIVVSSGPQPGYGIKRVVEKQSPVTLVGDDGSVCRTSRERFAATKEDRWIACLWLLPSLDSTEIAGLYR